MRPHSGLAASPRFVNLGNGLARSSGGDRVSYLSPVGIVQPYSGPAPRAVFLARSEIETQRAILVLVYYEVGGLKACHSRSRSCYVSDMMGA